MDGVWLALVTLAVAAGGGLLACVNVEAWLLGVSAVCPGATLVPVVLAATLGQVAAKILLYRAGGEARGWGARHRSARFAGAVQRLEGAALHGTAVVFASALTGVPPFYAVSVAAGMARFHFPRFLALALVGRALRFTLVFLVPRLVSVLGT